MDLKAKIEKAEKELNELVEKSKGIQEQINQLTNQKQLVAQDALRKDGELAVLKELEKETNGD